MRPPQPWRLEPTLRFLATLLFALAATGFATDLVRRGLGESGVPPAPWVLAGGTGLLHVIAVVALVPLLRAHGFGWRDAFGFLAGRWPRTLAFAAAATVPALLGAWLLHQGCGWVLDQLAIPHDTQAAVDAVRSATRWWERGALLFFAVGSAPLVEELLFRGVLWPLLRDRGWRITGCAAVSAAFALIHANAAAFVPLWFLGIFWTWLFERTGDLTAPILSHGIFNGTNFLWIVLAGSDLPA